MRKLILAEETYVLEEATGWLYHDHAKDLLSIAAFDIIWSR